MSSPAPTRDERRRARPGVRARRAARHPEGLERLRLLLAGAMGAVLIGYALLVPVAALLMLSGDAGSVDGAFAVAVPMWLAAHQIPVEVDGRALGVLPLVPTLVVVGVVAAASGWAVRRLGGRFRHDGGPVVAGQAGAAAAVAVLAGALLPGDVSVTTPWASMVGAGLLAGLAAGAGVLRACGLPPEWSRRLEGWPRAAVVGLRAGAAGLLLVGSVVVALALLVRAGAVADSFADLAPGVGASAGVALLAVGYLPNALVAGAAWALGPGFSVGAAQFGPFGAVPGPLPPFPLFAALPTEAAPGWAALVLLLPLGAGALTGRACRRVLGADAPLRERLAAAAAASTATALGAGVLAAVAGGSLAGGPYDPVALSPLGVIASGLVLLGVPATIASAGADELLGRPPSTRRSGRERTGGPARPGDERAARRTRPLREDAARDGRGGRARDADGRVRRAGDPDERDGDAGGREGRVRDAGPREGRTRDAGDHEGRTRDAGDHEGRTREAGARDGRRRDVGDAEERGDRDRSDREPDLPTGSGRDGSPEPGGRSGPAREVGTPPRTVADLVAQRASQAAPTDAPDGDGAGPADPAPGHDDPERDTDR